MSFSRYFACLAGSFLVSLSGWTADLPDAALGVTNITFRNHVQPVLAKFGCSSGACHGAAAGQNGFKLSLRGYDDEGDYIALTRQALGRRIIPADPGRSLLLLKPTAAIPHKGGKRFEVGSLEYRVLAEWISAGAPGPKTEDPRIERLEFLPDHVVLRPAATQQFTVRAHFSDHHTEDVTRWAKYTAANASVAQVDDNGNVQVVGTGEGPITAWYLSRIAIASVTVPGTNQVPPSVFAKAQTRNFIDDLALQKLQELNLPPSPRSTDAEFIRRAFLDTIGVLPTAQETREFLAESVGSTGHRPVPSGDSPDGTGATTRANGHGPFATLPAEVPVGGSPTGAGGSPAAPIFKTGSEDAVPDNKRDRLIESLLQRPEFVDYWSHKWSDLLLVSSKRLKPAAMWTYYRFIRNNVAANTPWDAFVRQIVTAQGSTLENGAGNFYVLHEDPRTMAETTTQAFLGMSINCAKCHNHPMEKWTNEQYYRFANLFARVRAKTGTAEGDAIIFVAGQGDVVQPLTGKAPPPTPLDGQPLPPQDARDRREALADWLTSRENPYFSRSIANRIWANFFDVGLIDPVDDLRVTNPASNEKLLTAIANYLADQRFDLKALMRVILQSETYQRSSVSMPENKADSRFYSRYYPRRLMAEVLLDAYSQVTGVPTEFQTDLRNDNRGLGEKYPLGLRAIQLPDTKIASYFLKTFGRPDREKTCECERTAEPNIAQVLHIANGDSINQKLGAKDNAISKQLAANIPPDKLVEDAYLSALSRYPTETERERMLKALGEAKESGMRPLVEDMYWALLSNKEFLFNH